MAETALKKAKRSSFMAFLDTTPTEETPTWNRMGKGITSQTVSYNPQTNTETYIDEDNATSNVDSYQPSMNNPQTVYSGDPCFDFVDGIRKRRATGDDCKSRVLLVNAYEAAGSSGTYTAEQNECTIQIDDFGGDAGGSLVINYTIHLCGDPVQGTFNPETKTFTPDGAGA